MEINDASKMWPSGGFTNCTYLTLCIIRKLHRSILQPAAKRNHTEASVLRQVLGNLRIFLWN